MTKAARAKKATKDLDVNTLLEQIQQLEEERKFLGVSLSQSKLKERTLEVKLARTQKEHKKAETALLRAIEQQKAIKDFRTGQAQVLLCAVHHLEEVVKGYADKASWVASDASNPEFKDRYVGQKLSTGEAEGEVLSIPAQGWEQAQEALTHELLQVS